MFISRNMDTTMIQLRLFIHQRLFSAAEEILGEVEKTLTVSLNQTELIQSKETVKSLRPQRDFLTKKQAARLPVTTSIMEHGEKSGSQLLQENKVPSTTQKSPEISCHSRDLLNKDWDHCMVETQEFKMPEIKEEQGGDEGPTPIPEIQKCEQDKREKEIAYEIESESLDHSAAGKESNNDEGQVNSNGEHRMMQVTKHLQGLSSNGNNNNAAAFPHRNSSCKGKKDSSFCPFCIKEFVYMGALVRHVTSHKLPNKCKICGKTCKSIQTLIIHFKTFCSKSFSHLKTPMMVHEEESSSQLLQENHVPSTPEESPEAPGPSDPITGLDGNNWTHCLEENVIEIKEEEEQGGDEGPTPEAVFPSHEIGTCEQDSLDSTATNERNNDEEMVKGKGDGTRKQEVPHRNPSGKCGKGYLTIGPLMKHVKSHRSQNDCKACRKTYQTPKMLTNHLKSCHSKPHDVSSKIFSDSGHLQKRKKRHKGVKEFVCQECGKIFHRFSHLTVHVRSHSGEKPYQCDFCGKALSQSQNLVIHKRIHTGERPYQCGLCGKRFVSKGKMTRHRAIHTK